jgi:hypothetical protein
MMWRSRERNKRQARIVCPPALPVRHIERHGVDLFREVCARDIRKSLHDWASHLADAFRTAAVMIREPERKKEPEKRGPESKLSPWS